MKRRLLIALLFTPLLLAVAIEFPFYLIRWIITGREFGIPLIGKLMEGEIV